RRDAGLVQGDDVQISLDGHYLTLGRDRGAGTVQSVPDPTLIEYWRFRRVQVLWRGLGPQRPRSESHCASIDVANREDHPVHEVIPRPALSVPDEPCFARH